MRPDTNIAMQIAFDMVRVSGSQITMVESDLRSLIDANSQMESAGHIFQPTLYRDMLYSENYKRNLAAATAAVAFVDALRAAGYIPPNEENSTDEATGKEERDTPAGTA